MVVGGGYRIGVKALCVAQMSLRFRGLAAAVKGVSTIGIRPRIVAQQALCLGEIVEGGSGGEGEVAAMG